MIETSPNSPPIQATIHKALINSGRAWSDALQAARSDQLPLARQICADYQRRKPPFPGAHELLLGRCLAEAASELEELEEAVALVRRALELNPGSIMAPHVLALALLRAGHGAEAAELLKTHRLPHDHALLIQMALTMETMLHPWPDLPADWPAWPSRLNPPTEPPDLIEVVPEPVTAESTKPRKRGLFDRRLSRLLPQLEKAFLAHRIGEVIRASDAAVEEGWDDPQLHLLAGMACEEAGDQARARAHLSRAVEQEPDLLMARTFLGRVYWRNGWNELAEDLWRSLPVEGPDDFGRHYHLALAHEAAGRRGEAIACMRIALSDFYMETREFYIERVHWRWKQTIEAEKAHEHLPAKS